MSTINGGGYAAAPRREAQHHSGDVRDSQSAGSIAKQFDGARSGRPAVTVHGPVAEGLLAWLEFD